MYPPPLMYPPGGFRGARPRNVLYYVRMQNPGRGVHYGVQIGLFGNGGNCTEMEGNSYARLVKGQCLLCGRQDSTTKQHHGIGGYSQLFLQVGGGDNKSGLLRLLPNVYHGQWMYLCGMIGGMTGGGCGRKHRTERKHPP